MRCDLSRRWRLHLRGKERGMPNARYLQARKLWVRLWNVFCWKLSMNNYCNKHSQSYFGFWEKCMSFRHVYFLLLFLTAILTSILSHFYFLNGEKINQLRSQVISLTQERDRLEEEVRELKIEIQETKKKQESRLSEPKFQISLIAREYNFPIKTALRIAHCESKTGTQIVNKSGSSAYGIYQFMPRTFNAYCEGSIKNDIDQIKCFVKLYNNHKEWWECA